MTNLFYSIDMIINAKKLQSKNYRLGQSMIEYILAFVAVVVVLIVAVGPGGILSSRIDESINEAIQGARCMTDAICYDPAGCTSICP